MPNATVDLFWSFRSPYSYISTPGALEVQHCYRVSLVFRPVLPLALRDPDFFTPANAKRLKYLQLDWARRAEMLGLPHVWPSPDPLVHDAETMRIAGEQPYLHRLTRLGVEAQRRGRGLEFAAEVSRLLFGGTRGWDQGDHLAQATARAGLDLADMERALDDSHEQAIEANHQALEASGHWGVPTFVFDGEPFFGQDRIDTLCWRLDQRGLRQA